MRRKWQLPSIVLVGAAAIGLFSLSTREKPASSGLGKSFEYDLAKYGKTDPSLIIATERAGIPVPFEDPTGIAVDTEDRIHVVGDSALIALDSDGAATARVDLPSPPLCVGFSPGDEIVIGFRSQVGMLPALDGDLSLWEDLGTDAVVTCVAAGDDDVFVADAGHRIVRRYDKAGTLLNTIGEKNEAKGITGFVIPSPYFDLALGPGNALWVVDPGRHELKNFTYDGALRSSWKKASMAIDGFCGCCNPTHIAIRMGGSFVTSEKGFVRVKVYNEIGDMTGVVAGPESFVEGVRGLDLAIDSEDRILVLDPQKKAVRIFELKEDTG